ncbi:hypothetical protein [uncultured Chryseobacterium sp.]|uniref:hypothetical protein n=1 Tax=uncultured Chryseobacterium sp. TaxID=259322 RepID=UPI0025E97D0C|nr:hypothetical protein [uncultured Chryseobacterium sp.]
MTIFLNDYSYNSISQFSHLSENQLLKVFDELYSNTYPEIFKSRESLKGIFVILFSLYLFSAISGWFIKKMIFSFKLEKSVSFLKFENQWDYIGSSNKSNNSNHKAGDRVETEVDIKTKGNELFTGKFKQYILDKDNAVESIIIKSAYKFYKLSKPDDYLKINAIKREIDSGYGTKVEYYESETTYVYKKKISDHLFIVNKGEIENIAIRYVKIGNIYDNFTEYAKTILSIVLILLILLSAINAIWDLGIYNFIGTLRRIVFSITVVFNIIFIANLIYSFFESKSTTIKKQRYDTSILLVYSFIPYIYVFAYIRFFTLVIIMIVSLFFVGLIINKVEKTTELFKDDFSNEDIK